MKPCTGCRFLVLLEMGSVCRAADKIPMPAINFYTGRREVHYGLRPRVVDMRAEGAACGPDARLWEPNWIWRLLRKG